MLEPIGFVLRFTLLKTSEMIRQISDNRDRPIRMTDDSREAFVLPLSLIIFRKL